MNKAGMLLNVFMLVTGFSCSTQEETGSRISCKDTRSRKEGVNSNAAGDKSKGETQKKECHPHENKSVSGMDPDIFKYMMDELRDTPRGESESSSIEADDKKQDDKKAA